MKRTAAIVLGLLTLTLSARADALDKKLVAADAKWLAHIDVEAAVKSSLFRHLADDKTISIDSDGGLQAIKQLYGIDPQQDIRSITLYGTGPARDHAVVLVRTNDKVDALLPKLVEQQGCRSVVVDGYTLHTCAKTDQGKKDDEWFGYVHKREGQSERIVLLSNQSERVIEAIGVLEGTRANLAAAAQPSVKLTPASGSIVFAEIAEGVGQLAEIEPSSAVARLAQSLVFELGERNELVFAHLAIQTASPENALKIQQVAQGAIALLGLATGEKASALPLQNLIGALNFNTRGSMMTADFSYGVQRLIDDLRTLGHDDDEDDDHDHDHDHERHKHVDKDD